MSATLAEPGCAAETCLMDWFTSINELHERVYAPYGLITPMYRFDDRTRDRLGAGLHHRR